MCTHEPMCESRNESTVKGTCREVMRVESGHAQQVLGCCFLSMGTGLVES